MPGQALTQRLGWIDVSKGVGIALVVLGHSGRGLTEANLPDPNSILLALDKAIYAFHMPLFFLLSGVTFGLRAPNSVYPDTTARIWRLLYSLVIWTYAFLAMRALAGNTANTSGAWADLARFPLPPFAHFWFLWALALSVFFFAVARLMLVPRVSERVFWMGAFGAALLAHHMTYVIPTNLEAWLVQALRYSVVFAAGGLLGSSRLVACVPSASVAVLSAVCFVISLWFAVEKGTPLSATLYGLTLSCLFLTPLMTLASKYENSLRVVAFLGLISLPIYVMHTMFSAAFRIVLSGFGITDLTIHLVLGTLIGLIGPAIAFLAFRRFKMLRVVGLA